MSAKPKKRAAPKKQSLSEMSLQRFGQRLKAAREAAGMTQFQVAYASGLSIARMSVIEKGQTDCRLSSAFALAAAVGVPLSDLVSD
jgi:transcriptional regulator with XRE-family HTH domain